MLDQMLILAEGEASTGGISPYLVGGSAFVILLCLLGITYLFSGLNQDVQARGSDVTRPHRTGDPTASGSPRTH